MTGFRYEGSMALVESVESSKEAGQAPAVASSSTDAAVICSGICKAYLPKSKGSDPFIALENVDLTVEDGQFLTILGPSGCGKTTLLNIMAGIDTATRG